MILLRLGVVAFRTVLFRAASCGFDKRVFVPKIFFVGWCERMFDFFVAIYEFFYTAFNLLVAAFSSFRVWDVLDIVIIAFVLYKVIILFRDTRSKQLIKGIFILLLIWSVARLLNLIILSWVFSKAVDYVIIASVVIFQPELRRALERVGYSKLKIIGFGSAAHDESAVLESIDRLCKAVGTMHDGKIGALIVIERDSPLNEIVATGTVIDARVSPELVCNVFYPKSPLHDGAMIIRDNKVYAAACILPLTSRNNVDKELGTRHRAAIGLSETSDAVVLVVSEETGNISLVMNGEIKRNYNPQTLREELKNILTAGQDEGAPVGLFGKLKSKFRSKRSGSDDSESEVTGDEQK